MIPKGEWSSLTEIGDYLPLDGFPPALEGVSVSDYTPGPIELVKATNDLHERWWQVSWLGGSVFITGATNGVWQEAINLFNTALPSKLALCFDQIGRPTVFFSVGPQLKLYWYNSVTEQQEITDIDTGETPLCAFDIVYNPGDANSDILLFYIDALGEIIMLQQRDRFGVKYPTGIKEGGPAPLGGTIIGLQALSCGMRTDYRYQVAYRYKVPGYKPDEPIPPVVIPPVIVPPKPDEPAIDPYWSYRLSGMQSYIETGFNIIENPNTESFHVRFYIDDVDLDRKEIGLFSQNLNLEAGRYGAGIYVTVKGENKDVLKVIIGGALSEFKMPFPIQPGHWKFEFQPLAGRQSRLFVSLKRPGDNSYDLAPTFIYQRGGNLETAASFIFGAVHSYSGRTTHNLKGVMRDCVVINTGVRNYWLIRITDKDKGGFPPIFDAAGDEFPATAYLRDYRPDNWILNK